MMTLLLDLPPELLENILLNLERVYRKNIRCTSRMCQKLVTPFVFDRVTFDLELAGCERLVAIAANPALSQFVKTIHLRRRSGTKHFVDFYGWHTSNVHEYVPFDTETECERVLDPIQALPLDEWKALGEKGQRSLYHEYEAERNATEAYIGRLAAAMSSMLLQSPNHATHNQSNATDAQQLLSAFTGAIRKLSNVRNLEYTPAYENEDDWGRTWRNIEFDPYGLIGYGDFGSDPDVDALQLFIALRTTLLAPNALCAVELFTRSQAFWSVGHLRRLLDWSERLGLRSYPNHDSVEEGLEEWTEAIGGPLAVMHHTEALTRALVTMECGSARLTKLVCRINTSWLDNGDELTTTAKALSYYLRQAVKLEQLELVFRESAPNDGVEVCNFDGFSLQSRVRSREALQAAVKVSHHLLIDSAPGLQRLRRLHLSCATGVNHLLSFFTHLPNLRFLCLNFVTLLPSGGQWNTVLEWIPKHLRLDDIKLYFLEDTYGQQRRLLLCPDAPVWEDSKTDQNCYAEYEKAIVRYALRQSNVLPPISPEEFLSQRCRL